MSSKNQVTGIDFTLACSVTDELKDVIAMLTPWCTKWVFQKEKGAKTGHMHWQGRVRLRERRRLQTITNKFMPGASLSVTSKEVHMKGDFNYVMKEDTRVEGPWSDAEWMEPPPLTRQLKEFMEMDQYKWQTQLYEMAKEWNDRTITVIYDTAGCSGKSIFCEWLEYNQLAFEMPPFRAMEDIMACAMCVPAQKCYLIDMPRGMKKDKMADFYAGLESLKNGVAYDKRYAFKKRRMDRPQIFVFTNLLPKLDLLTPDRWKIFTIGPAKELVVWEKNP